MARPTGQQVVSFSVSLAIAWIFSLAEARFPPLFAVSGLIAVHCSCESEHFARKKTVIQPEIQSLCKPFSASLIKMSPMMCNVQRQLVRPDEIRYRASPHSPFLLRLAWWWWVKSKQLATKMTNCRSHTANYEIDQSRARPQRYEIHRKFYYEERGSIPKLTLVIKLFNCLASCRPISSTCSDVTLMHTHTRSSNIREATTLLVVRYPTEWWTAMHRLRLKLESIQAERDRRLPARIRTIRMLKRKSH